MQGFDNFLGNSKLISRLKQDIASGHISHAYIIEGKEGFGKLTLAKLIASALSCESEAKPCMECNLCRKIKNDITPDIVNIVAEKDKVWLGVDVIRKLRDEAVFAPIELSKRFFIIPYANTMNNQAQNALLKILEEPPNHVMFLILCENSENLLATVKSRAPILRLEALPDSLIEEHLLKTDENAQKLYNTEKDAFHAAIKSAGGSLGIAKLLMDKKKASNCLAQFSKVNSFIDLLSNKKNSADELAFHEFATALAKSKQRDEITHIYLLILEAVRDLINIKLSKKPEPIFYFSESQAREKADKFSVSYLFKLEDIIKNAVTSLEHNANIGLVQVKTATEAVFASKIKN